MRSYSSAIDVVWLPPVGPILELDPIPIEQRMHLDRAVVVDALGRMEWRTAQIAPVLLLVQDPVQANERMVDRHLVESDDRPVVEVIVTAEALLHQQGLIVEHAERLPGGLSRAPRC